MDLHLQFSPADVTFTENFSNSLGPIPRRPLQSAYVIFPSAFSRRARGLYIPFQ